MRQRGFAFLPFLLANWQLLALGIVVLSAFLYYKHCEFIKNEHSALVNNLKVAAIENDKKVKAAIEQSRKEKERTDRETKELRSRNASLAKRLRDERSRGSYVPPASPTSKRPDLACFDRGELDRATRQLDESLSGLAEICDQRTIDLDTAKRWAQR